MQNLHQSAKRIHLITGLLLATIFIASGIYLRLLFEQETGTENIGFHMLYRANHVHLLTAALVNLLLIANLRSPLVRWQYLLQRLASFAVLTGSVLIVTAFLLEPQHLTLNRPFTLSGIVTLAAGVLVLLLANLKRAS